LLGPPPPPPPPPPSPFSRFSGDDGSATLYEDDGISVAYVTGKNL
jgi:hypothetical protein